MSTAQSIVPIGFFNMRYQKHSPPQLVYMTEPVIQPAQFEIRNASAAALSAGGPTFPNDDKNLIIKVASWSSKSAPPLSVIPGVTVFTVILGVSTVFVQYPMAPLQIARGISSRLASRIKTD